MGLVTVRPSSTISNTGVAIGGGAASLQAATSDNNVVTYASLTFTSQMWLGVTNPVLPGNSRWKSIAVRAQMSSAAASPKIWIGVGKVAQGLYQASTMF